MCVRGKLSPAVPRGINSVFSSHVLYVLTSVLLQSVGCLHGVHRVAQSDLGQTWCCESPVRLGFLTRTLSEELQLCHLCTVHCCCELTAHPGGSLSKASGLFAQACLVCKQQRTILPLWEAGPEEAVIYLPEEQAPGDVVLRVLCFLLAVLGGPTGQCAEFGCSLLRETEHTDRGGEVVVTGVPTRWVAAQASQWGLWLLWVGNPTEKSLDVFSALSDLAAIKPGWGRVWRQAELKQGDSYTPSSWLLWASGVHITFAHVMPWHSSSVCTTDWNCDRSQ